jgi:hypothetical protein
LFFFKVRKHHHRLGGLADKTYVKIHNDDKYTEETHVQTKLRLPRPLTVYVVKLTDHPLPWLTQEGWALTSMEGVTYHGTHSTRHKEWIIGAYPDTSPTSYSSLPTDHFGPGQVYEKTFPAGTVEMRGNSGGDGSYLIFIGNPTGYHLGEVGANSCPSEAVSEADCLQAAQELLPDGVVQGRTTLVAGNWGWVPPGCSVQSHQGGDWAAHYNTNPNGANDGGYTPVCLG